MKNVFDRTTKWAFALGLIYYLPASCGDKHAKPTVAVPEEFVPGSFLIERNTDTSEADFHASVAAIAAKNDCELKSVTGLDWDSTLKGSRVASNNVSVAYAPLTHTSMVKFAGCDLDKQSTRQIAVQLNKDATVAKAEVEAEYKIANSVGTDPLASWQTHHETIRTDEACKYTKEDSPEIVVAVIDTGIDMQHPDLQGRFVERDGKAICANFVGKGSDEQPDGNCQDDNGHGTHVAGTIAANRGNSIGGYGVAACTKVKILNVKAMDSEGRGKVSQINRGVKWAIDQGAQFINLSIVSFSEIRNSEDFKSSLYDYASEKNVMVIAASGNSGERNGDATFAFPASFDKVVSVGAVEANLDKSDYSVYGPRVSVSAPGTVLSTFPTYLGKDHDEQSGTSMATPQVTAAMVVGVSAVQSKLGLNGRYPSVEAQKLLLNSVNRKDSLRGVFDSAGVVDAKLLTENMLASVSVENQKEQPTPQKQTDEQVTQMRFVGLNPNQNVGGQATKVALKGLPSKAKYVGLYWGVDPVDKESAAKHFSLSPVEGSVGTLNPTAKWMFKGNSKLSAVAYDEKGKLLKKIGIPLKG